LGQNAKAILACQRALSLEPRLWQSHILVAQSQAAQGECVAALASYQQVLRQDAHNPSALLGAANLALNEFGDPMQANRLVQPLLGMPEYAMDAQLTNLMSRLYERDVLSDSAVNLSREVMAFAKRHLQLAAKPYYTATQQSKGAKKVKGVKSDKQAQQVITRARPRVALLSPQFGVSPVYFLTIAGWRKVARECEVIIFNRGHQQDWATQQFAHLASQWINVQHMGAAALAQTIYESDIDVLYDLGGWMDPLGLQALSLRPARVQYKWVGGQSITTGLDCFDGWIGDVQHSPAALQHLYSEPLINVPGSYVTYTPPTYLPKRAEHKSTAPCVFSNPAKVSRAFLQFLKKSNVTPVFIHRQFRHAAAQERVIQALGEKVRFICPGTHQDALDAVNAHTQMIDTFPYSSGLTAQEALAMGTQVRVLRVGELFCERHTAALQKPGS
jgi:predicted O-linked N-acetylglucosamine transferase (SPINDLY family)